jgi:homoprotocatechuate degradation regulator HpaR
MIKPFVHRNLPRLLLQARESVMAHTRPGLREHGLSDQQWRVLRVLGEHGTVETGRVAREAFILGPSLTGVLARMERDGLIRRERDPQDQRRSVVEATARGLKLVEKLSRTIEAHYDWMEQSLGKQKTGAVVSAARRSHRTGAALMQFLPFGTVYGTLLNFRGELDLLGAQMHQPPYKAPPVAPVLYVKTANTWTAHGRPIALPARVPEVEVGATIGMIMGGPSPARSSRWASTTPTT